MHKVDHRIKSRRGERGQGLVEFAFSLVFMLILLVGIVDAARALFTYMALRDAAQEGALYASLNPPPSGDTTYEHTDAATATIRTRVQEASDTVKGMGANLQVKVIVTGAACMGSGVTIIASNFNFPITMPFLGTILGKQTIPISASVTNTILRPPC